MLINTQRFKDYNTMIDVTSFPERIWLVPDADETDVSWYSAMWSTDMITHNDVQYVRADLVKEFYDE